LGQAVDDNDVGDNARTQVQIFGQKDLFDAIPENKTDKEINDVQHSHVSFNIILVLFVHG